MFSIVIPLYNKEKNIKHTIDSVLNQSVQDFEIVVVDDGSTDNSLKVIKSISDPRIKVYHKENGGVCSARNYGLSIASYEYIAFLDADDLWDKDYLFEQSKLIKDFPEASMWGINFAEMSNGQIVRNLPTGLSAGYRGYVENYFTIKGRISDLFCSSSVVIRKNIFSKTGNFDERLKYCEDIDMWYRIIAISPVVFYDRFMVFYQFDAENRALNRKIKLESYLPFYSDKYTIYKKQNFIFYQFIIRWCSVKLKEIYFNDKTQREKAYEAMGRLDFSVLSPKYRLFYNLPYILAKPFYMVTEKINQHRK